MAALTTQRVVRPGNGLTPAYAAADVAGDTFVPGDRVFLHFKNTNGATRTVTVATPGTVAEFAVADYTATIPATTGDKMIGPFPSWIFGNPANGGVANITYDAVAGLTVAVVEIP